LTRSTSRILMVDNGHCFNELCWTFPRAKAIGVFREESVYDSITGLDDFRPWLDIVESWSDLHELTKLAGRIPPEWYSSETHALKSLLHRLVRRSKCVWRLLAECCNAYPDWFKRWESVVLPLLQNRLPQVTAPGTASVTPASDSPTRFIS
jgi:hypothetical protein